LAGVVELWSSSVSVLVVVASFFYAGAYFLDDGDGASWYISDADWIRIFLALLLLRWLLQLLMNIFLSDFP
jgi:hypothetical protein